MGLGYLRRQRAVGLDVGQGSIKALRLERRRSGIAVSDRALVPVDEAADPRQLAQAIHAALATARADGAPVVAAVGGPDVVIRQVSLPPVPAAKILPALEIQHRELGLLPPGDAVIDAQVLRRSREGAGNDVLSVSVPRARIDERLRLLQLAAVNVRVLDVEPLALLNGAIHLTSLEAGELLVLLTIGRRGSVLCLYSDQGPVVARYLDAGAEHFAEGLRAAFDFSPDAAPDAVRALTPAQAGRAEAACRDVVARIADDVRLSLAFYRTEYDRESLPRYAIAGTLEIPPIPRWIADRLGLAAALEIVDPLRTGGAPAASDATGSGPEFLQAFGLALRAL